MAENKIVTGAKPNITTPKSSLRNPAVNTKPSLILFEKDNYMWMGIGAVIVALGMFLMSGGKNIDPNQFDTKLVYSATRITIAPILILAGFVIEIYAIFKRSKARA